VIRKQDKNMDRTPERKSRMNFKNRTPTGAWKDRFRQGCLDRLKNKRQDLVESLRRTGGSPSSESPSQSSQDRINQVMVDEWHKMKLESPILNLPGCSSNKRFKFAFDDDEFEDIEEILNVFEDIQSDLLKEEMQMLAEYEDIVSFDDDSLCAAIDMLSTKTVTCPVCKRNNLLQNKHIIFCQCGVRVDTKEDAINLKFVESQLQNLISTHGVSCKMSPDFGLIDMTGDDMKNIIMTCQSCDCMEIVV